MAPTGQLVFAPLGGVGEIGMNLSIYGLGDERRRQWLIVDVGVSFATEEHLPGIDLIFPDIRYLVEERKNIAGIVITHAHEDHFGALFDLWPQLKVPVYATPFTAALIEAKRQGEAGAPEIDVKTVPLGSRFNVGPFDIELVSMAHSIPESNALILRTPHGNVLHTGDWKLDPTPVVGQPTDEAKLRRLGEEGALAVMGDSTNAVRDGRSPSEADVARTLAKLDRVRPGACGRYSALMLPLRMTSPQRAVSAATCLPKASGVPSGSVSPCPSSRALRSGDENALLASALTQSIAARGVPARTGRTRARPRSPACQARRRSARSAPRARAWPP